MHQSGSGGKEGEASLQGGLLMQGRIQDRQAIIQEGVLQGRQVKMVHLLMSAVIKVNGERIQATNERVVEMLSIPQKL